MALNIHRVLPFFFVLITSLFTSALSAQNADARMMVHLLDYIAVDYSMAVKDSVIINAEEYGEMQEFAAAVENLASESDQEIKDEISKLQLLISEKSSIDLVGSTARSIKSQLIDIYKLSTAPEKWPSLDRGKVLYAGQCKSCHGESGKGDGPLAENLVPAPTNFHEPDKANGLSPFQAYNTIKLGVSNTAMVAFSDLNEQELWDLAFYIISISHQEKGIKQPTEMIKASREINLEALASLSNEAISEELIDIDTNSEYISALRLYPKEVSQLIRVDYISKAQALIRLSEKAYYKGDFNKARKFSLSAYLDGVEPIEMQLSANDASFVSELEGQLSKMRAAIERRAKNDIIGEETQLSIEILEKARNIMESTTFSPWLTFTLSSTIILREGLEAFLVIITMLGVIRALKLKAAARWVHFGWVTAVVFGFIMWLVADSLFTFSGAQREIMEGFIALFAVVILLYVGFWMHSKSEASKWKAYVQNKIERLAKKENMFGLALLSFLVVFREAFESVLFLSALSSEAGTSNSSALFGGIAVAILALGLISVLLLKYSKRLPISKLFKYSAAIIAVLAFVLVGKGFHALQEAGYIGISNTPFNLRIDLLGLYPTWQSFAAQIVTLVLIIILWRISSRPASSAVKA